MNNTSIEICSDSSDYGNASHNSHIIWSICGFVFIMFGIPGNLFQILLMSNKTNRKEPTSLYWIAIAICEIIFLAGMFWLWCVSMSIIKTDPREIFSCGIFYSILIGSTILSNLYLASMSVSRARMTISPIRHRLVITRRRIFIRILSIFITVIIIMIPHHFYFYYDSKTTIFICEFYAYIDQWKIHMWPFMHAVLFVSLPSILTCISAVILLRNRYNHRKKQKNKLSESARQMERNSVVLLCISIAILFSLLPTAILEIFIVHDLLFNQRSHCTKRLKMYRILVNWFWIFSSLTYAFKFYLRLAISKAVRRDFSELIRCSLRQEQNNNAQI
ncbi:unnamed protein product [Rotaria socialis]|uniref:G-protein coupled receptors family 1 profile domain-containing protein n=2 Tax=Rotaria socialis TaxID=392032 RepID=A0A817LL67_9BILA|nr:unnamed protein product [Rotaria socialis]CAF3370759.1 unnamed protein product [Rotaria socialis]CAF3376777.1 unnamed protein product [Rotaria socialis]CAF3406103.1 unnamed protein product [Rotaria socialis]CAF3523622.1 unnamed protein product [Rotaria socialis]